MAKAIIMCDGAGAASDECTAQRSHVLAGKTAVTQDSEDDPAAGTMPNHDAWTSRLGINGRVTIPKGFHSGSGYVDQAVATQGALTLKPGTTAKTGAVSGKYMTGNITVPAVNIPAAYIKKGQKITFPDGSSVIGTFEGWVPTPQDLYYNGVNTAGFTIINENAVFENTRIRLLKLMPQTSTGVLLDFSKAYDVKSYSKLIVEGLFKRSYSTSPVKAGLKPSKDILYLVSGEVMGDPVTTITVDISQLTTIGSDYVFCISNTLIDSYITRIRLA